MTIDPIVSLESLGYTQREAAFLYLVAIHSGYFLRRQFDYFIDRNRGGIVARFLEKGRINGHIRFLDSRHGRQVYHLTFKPIYRLLGIPDSQNQRVKGDAEVRARLIKLDYVLENNRDHYLATDAEKLQFFSAVRRLDSQFYMTTNGTLYPELRSMPISLVDRTSPSTSLVRCAFIDEGLLTTAKFDRVISAVAPTLAALRHFELVYVASSDHKFKDAATIFWKKFRAPAEVQSLLATDWRNPTRSFSVEHATLRPRFVTLLLRFNYPPLRRLEQRCSVECSSQESGQIA
jgi:hypothetical protein